MKVSIITVCYNSAKTIRDTIESVKSQTYKNIEYIIVDGKSIDNTLGIVNEYHETVDKVICEKDSGIYDAMNKGITLSKGKWLYFLGTEDVFFNDTVLEYIFNDLSLEKETIVAGKIVYQGKKKPFIHSKNKMVKEVSWSNSMWIRNGLHHQGTLYKKALFKNKKND